MFCSHVYVREQTIWSSTVSTATYGGTGCSSPICLLLLVWLQPSARLVPAAGCGRLSSVGPSSHAIHLHRPGDDAILRRLQQRQLLCTSTSSCLFVSCGRRPSRTLPSSLGGDQRTSLACVKRPVGNRTSRPAELRRDGPLKRQRMSARPRSAEPRRSQAAIKGRPLSIMGEGGAAGTLCSGM